MMVLADACGCTVAMPLCFVLTILPGRWQMISVISLFTLMTLIIRFVYQLICQRKNIMESAGAGTANKIGVAIVGAGQIGMLLAEELIFNRNSHYKPICFIDNDPSKIGNSIGGIKVYGENKNTIMMLKSMPVQEIFIALPKIDGETASHMLKYYRQTGCKVKLYDFPLNENMEKISGKRVMREFSIEDLLFRTELDISKNKAASFYLSKVVLVTGGGGSIGSELCRQIAKCLPKQLIILDIYENNAYDIEQELKQQYGDSIDVRVEIASVRDRTRLDAVFAHYRPEIVFHAAAHKHVPLMEHSNCEAVKNNVCGTFNTADMAEKYGVKKFILVSTDKAVNPTNIMGASKRMCEMIVQCRRDSKTSFAAVRFGNVLGSNGSVIPLFRRQIEKGGPVTITDKRIIRYFMTIPEAARLLIQTGAMAQRGELFVLNMGKPVKILEMAENMIRLSGHTPYEEIDIVEVGLRPGEKLYEELLMQNEKLRETENKTIFIETDTPLSREEVDKKLEILKRAVKEAENQIESPIIKQAMKAVVPTYREPDEVNSRAEASKEMQDCRDADFVTSETTVTVV